MKARNRWWSKVIGMGLLMGGTVMYPAAQSNPGDKKEKEQVREAYAASAMVRAGGRSTMMTVTIHIDGFSPDAEVLGLAETLRDQGSEALLKAMGKLKAKGRLAPTGHIGTDIRVIRSRPTEKGGRRVILVTDRPITFAELRQGSRSRDYEFGIIQLDLDEHGKGEGALLAAAKIKFNDDNTIEFEHYGIDPVRLMNVRKM